MRRAAAVAGLALAGLLAPWDPAGGTRSERLEQLRADIEAREAAARAFADEAEGYLGELEALDRQLAETRRSARRLREKLGQAEGERKMARAALAEAERTFARTRRTLETRLVALYKVGGAAGLAALYSAEDIQGFLRRRDALARIVAEDARLFEAHRGSLRARREGRRRLDDVVAELEGARRELRVREDRIRQTHVERTNVVALLRSRSDRERRAAGELRQAAARLEAALERMAARGVTPPGRGLVRGKLPWPVEGRIRHGFGRDVDPEFGTEVLRNGIELEAPRGAAVRAVAAGRVLFAGWFRGYGQIVILDHGARSVTVSGYLDEVAVEVGSQVGQGEVVGTVGDTGSLSGPGLYFEIRRQGKPVDPAGWMSSGE